MKDAKSLLHSCLPSHFPVPYYLDKTDHEQRVHKGVCCLKLQKAGLPVLRMSFPDEIPFKAAIKIFEWDTLSFLPKGDPNFPPPIDILIEAHNKGLVSDAVFQELFDEMNAEFEDADPEDRDIPKEAEEPLDGDKGLFYYFQEKHDIHLPSVNWIRDQRKKSAKDPHGIKGLFSDVEQGKSRKYLLLQSRVDDWLEKYGHSLKKKYQRQKSTTESTPLFSLTI